MGNILNRSEQHDYFRIERKSTFDGYVDYLIFEDLELAQNIRDIFSTSNMYRTEPFIILTNNIVNNIPLLRKYVEKIRSDSIRYLYNYLTKRYQLEIDKINRMINNSEIDFNSLPYLFTRGDEVIWIDNQNIVAGILTKTIYNLYSINLYISVMKKMDDGELYTVEEKININNFFGVKKIQDLPVRPIDSVTKLGLIERGKRFLELIKKPSYVNYDGLCFDRNNSNNNKYIKGRIILDHINFHKYYPKYTFYKRSSIENKDSKNECINNIVNDDIIDNIDDDDDIDDDDIDDNDDIDDDIYETKQIKEIKIDQENNNPHIIWPYLLGYSMTKKIWAEFYVDNITEIKFDDKSFDYLVLPDESKINRKEFIISLVKNYKNSFTDIIKNKNGGLIFLLHGPSGVGKTLTAEATAELLHTPLYSITMSELGQSIQYLEENLSNAMNLAQSWNAVLLLDEVDIFIEKRNNFDIIRNGMVATFLRLLEYNNGIIFMTTNRVNTLDEAIKSRISMIFCYPELTKEMRIKIWKNLLQYSELTENISNEDIVRISDNNYNGRQIKTIINISKAYALSQKQSLNITHIDKIISLELTYNIE